MSRGYFVSCFDPNVDTRIVPRHVGGQQHRDRCSGERTLRSHRVHKGCWEGEAEVFQDDYHESFRCEGCGQQVVTWDYDDTVRDGGDVPPMDDDGLWPPESLERRGA